MIAEAHLPGATRVHVARFQSTFTNAALNNTGPDTRLIVAVDEGDTILGYIHLQPTQDDVLQQTLGYLTIIAVSESAAGKGIGRTLMQAAEDWAREQGYPALVLDVFASNKTARRFYEKHGFSEDSVQMRWLTDANNLKTSVT